MKTLELRTVDGRCIARHVYMACSFRLRCLGWLRRDQVPEHEGILLVPGGSIHTLGMRFSIDVVFLSRQMRVLKLVEQVPPWRVVIAPRDTRRVLELPAGKIAATRLTPGDYLIAEFASQDPSERPTIKPPSIRHMPCERSPIRFSLRLPIERRCTGPLKPKCGAAERAVRTLPPYLRVLDFRAKTKRSAEN